MKYAIEPLTEADRTDVVDIFNHFVRTSFAAFPEKPVGYETFDRFVAMVGDYPAVAVKSDAGDTVGFGFLRPYHSADTLRRAAEITYFILPQHTDKGLGSRILEHFSGEAKARGIDILLASISSLNEQSIAFHKKHGFVECGRFREIGKKQGRTFDIVWMQKML